jgi:hypothetical protein
MVDGIYTMTYLGASGDWGMGMLVLRQGIVVGADAVGGLYDGRYIETPDSLNVEMAAFTAAVMSVKYAFKAGSRGPAWLNRL